MLCEELLAKMPAQCFSPWERREASHAANRRGAAPRISGRGGWTIALRSRVAALLVGRAEPSHVTLVQPPHISAEAVA